MSDTNKILTKARELIADPESWTQRTFARDENGYAVFPADRDAICFCAVGAMRRAAFDLGYVHNGLLTAPYVNAKETFFEGIKHRAIDIPMFNDDPGTDHGDVLVAFDLAITASEVDPDDVV